MIATDADLAWDLHTGLFVPNAVHGVSLERFLWIDIKKSAKLNIAWCCNRPLGVSRG